MTKTLADTIAELRKLDQKATTGPWNVSRHERSYFCRHGIVVGQVHSDEDAALICAMRNALPALLAEIERLKVPQ